MHAVFKAYKRTPERTQNLLLYIEGRIQAKLKKRPLLSFKQQGII